MGVIIKGNPGLKVLCSRYFEQRKTYGKANFTSFEKSIILFRMFRLKDFKERKGMKPCTQNSRVKTTLLSRDSSKNC
jgi:hypothetical protein